MTIIAVPLAPASPQLKPHITHLALRARLGDHRTAIDVEALTDPVVLTLKEDWRAAKFIDLADPRVAQGLDVLVAMNLLPQAVRDSVLNDPIQDEERP